MYGTHGETEIKHLKCKLDHDEVHSRADQVATILGEREDLEREKKSAVDAFKDKIGQCETTIAHMGRQVRERAEYRDVECKWLRDDVDGKMILTREDTGEVLHQRPLTDDEKQLKMFQGKVVTDEASGDA